MGVELATGRRRCGPSQCRGFEMSTPAGFWSYVHADDEAEGGRIVQLARDLQAQYELLTGEPIELFLDKDSIAWGEDWQKKIDESIEGLAFFIPVLTPRFFLSAACRRELQAFARSATALGVRELVLPIVYVEFDGLRDEAPVDDAVVLVKSYQWEDWTDLRLADVSSSEHRRGVARLAERLTRANRAAETRALASTASVRPSGGVDQDEEPGTLDLLADGEAALPAWIETVQQIGLEMGRINGIVSQATEDMNRPGTPGNKVMATRLVVTRRLAHDLQEPAERILALGNAYASQTHEVDGAIRTLIDVAPGSADTTQEQVCSFFASVRTASQSARKGLDSLQGMVEAIRPVESMSRDLRVPLRLMRQGLTVMYEGGSITDEWLRLIDASPVSCFPEAEPRLEG